MKFPLTLVSESFHFLFSKTDVFWLNSAIEANLLHALEGPLARVPFWTQDEAGSPAEVAVEVTSRYLCPNLVFQGL